jgi:hypothetical protein
MKKLYRIFVLGEIPPDLKERVAAIHAAGIVKSKNENTRLRDQDINRGPNYQGKIRSGNGDFTD